MDFVEAVFVGHSCLCVDVLYGLYFLAVFRLHVYFRFEAACRHLGRLIVEVERDAVALAQIERMFLRHA